MNQKEKYQKNKENILESNKKWVEKNKNRKKELNKLYREKNRKILYNYNRIYQREKYKNNIEFKICSNLRTRFYFSIKGYKIQSVLDLIGCSIEELKNHLEINFLNSMSWENHGKIWEIDHIKPCSSFDLTKLEEQQKCFHYSNLQPLFKTTDIAKNFGYENEIGNRNKLNN